MQLPLHLTLSVLVCLGLLCSAPQAGAAPVPTTTTLAVTSGGSAVTTVTSGSVVTLTATVLAGTTPVTVGQVNFCDAAATYCTDVKQLGTAQLTSAGTATFRLRPGVGSHNFNAIFVGTPRGATAYAGSTSSTATLTVTAKTGPNQSVTGISQSGSIGNYTLTATVGGSASAAPTGTVTFFDTSNGNSVLGTSTLGAGKSGVNFLNLSNPAAGSSPYSVVVGDFNGDGIPDLAVPDATSNTITVYLGDGDGTFTATAQGPIATGTGPRYVAEGDFNGDGNLDLAVVNSTDGTVSILLGDGTGSFEAKGAVTVGITPEWIVTGDFNGDGIQDLAVGIACGDRTCYESGNIIVLLGDGTGNFTQGANILIADGLVPPAVAVGDFNGDGNLDLAVTTYLEGDVVILLGNGDGTFVVPETNLAAGGDASSVQAGDFTENDILDLAVANCCTLTSNLTILMGNGDGGFAPTASSIDTGSNPTNPAIADFNADGVPDLAQAWPGQEGVGGASLVGGVTILLGDGDGTFTPTLTSAPAGYNPQWTASGDFNGDGLPDLAVANLGEGASDQAGSVTVLLDESQSAAANVTAVAVQPTASGMHQVVAMYSGDANYAPSASVATVVSAALGTPTVTITPASSSITTSEGLTLTVAVTGPTGEPTPAGTVTLQEVSNYNSGPTTLSNGSATFNIPAGTLPAGVFSFSASYSGNADYQTGTGSAQVTVTVAPFTLNGTPVTLAGGATTGNTSTITVVPFGGFTGSVALSASVTSNPAGATSPPTLSFGSTTPVSITVPDAGKATLTIGTTPSTTPAVYSITITGTSGSNTAATTIALTVSGITPTVTVSPSTSRITTGQVLPVDVSVSGPAGDPTPTGSITLTSGSYNSGAITLSDGTAQFNILAGALATGSDTLTVKYAPDSVIYLGAGGTATVNVTLGPPTVFVTPSESSITPLQTLGVAIAVSGPAGEPTPTGSVVLTSGGYTSTPSTLSGGSAQINVPAGALAAGSDTLTANYTPDSASSSLYLRASGTGTVVVSYLTPTVTVTPLATSILTTQALQVNVSASGPAGDPTPTGSVDLTSGSYDSGAGNAQWRQRNH
jgi:hypothetical protein